MMWDNLNEQELLSLIEDELSPQEVAALRRRLAQRPDLLALLDQLVEDRLALLAAPDPQVPEDVLARLEPILARPMLMSQPPGRLRRARQRQRRRRQSTHFAAALVLVLAAGGGVWVVLQSLVPSQISDPLALPQRQTQPAPPLATTPPPVPLTSSPAQPAPNALATAPREPKRSTAANNDGPTRVEFALLIVADSSETAEEAMVRVAHGVSEDVAVVRNFSESEFFSMLEQQQLTSGMVRSSQPDRTARMGIGDNDVEIEWAMSDPIRVTGAPDVERKGPVGRQLTGEEGAAPSYTEQLELSNLGASHTIAIRASQLGTFLAELDEAMGGQTALDMLSPNIAPTVTIEGQVRWVVNARLVRESMRVLDSGGDGIILLPVVIREKPSNP